MLYKPNKSRAILSSLNLGRRSIIDAQGPFSLQLPMNFQATRLGHSLENLGIPLNTDISVETIGPIGFCSSLIPNHSDGE